MRRLLLLTCLALALLPSAAGASGLDGRPYLCVEDSPVWEPQLCWADQVGSTRLTWPFPAIEGEFRTGVI
jgi:hypothetical protein